MPLISHSMHSPIGKLRCFFIFLYTNETRAPVRISFTHSQKSAQTKNRYNSHVLVAHIRAHAKTANVCFKVVGYRRSSNQLTWQNKVSSRRKTCNEVINKTESFFFSEHRWRCKSIILTRTTLYEWCCTLYCKLRPHNGKKMYIDWRVSRSV